jgi:hypothetical protein
MSNLYDKLSIIITTSPIRLNPSTKIIEKIFDNFRYIDGLNDCIKIIICDGYNIDDIPKYKSGVITNDEAERYLKYISNLNKLIENNILKNTKLIIRETRYGFANNVQYALDLITTKYVLIYQHDWLFVRSININHILDIIDSRNDIKYVSFVSSPTENYVKKLNYHMHKYLKEETKGNGIVETYTKHFSIPLIPLDFWYDKPHICSVEFYKEFVFGKQHYDYKQQKYFKVKNFIEDTLGQVEKNDIKLNGLSAHAKYGTYLLYDFDHLAILHINGRRIINESILDTIK